MPGQRGISARRSRGSWALRIAGTVLAIATAATVASVLVLTQGTARARRQSAPSLPRHVLSTVAIGLVNPGPPPRRDSRPVPGQLYLSATGLAFAPPGRPSQASAAGQWTAARMSDGTYILIYAPDGRCLTAPSSPAAQGASLSRCNLSLRRQRWLHEFQLKDAAGLGGWRLRSFADRLCLTAVNPPLGGQPGESGVAMSACSSPVPWRQAVSFRTAY